MIDKITVTIAFHSHRRAIIERLLKKHRSVPAKDKAESRSVGRPRSFNEEKALDQAMQVFWRKGFEGASLSDLTTAIGIKPASLYAAFGNKQALFHKALERYRSHQVPFIYDALAEPTALAVAERLLRESAIFLTRPSLPPRCMTMQTVGASEEGSEVHDELILVRKDAQKALRRRFERAKREHDLPGACNPAGLARFVTAVCQGMNLQSIDGASRKQLLEVARTALRAWPMAKRS